MTSVAKGKTDFHISNNWLKKIQPRRSTVYDIFLFQYKPSSYLKKNQAARHRAWD
jgi:hypothetical protein